MPIRDLATVTAILTLGDADPIDGGDTIALRLTQSDGAEIGLLIPHHLCAPLIAKLSDAAEQAAAGRGRRVGDAI